VRLLRLGSYPASAASIPVLILSAAFRPGESDVGLLDGEADLMMADAVKHLHIACEIERTNYEDGVLHEAARAAGATVIVTRDRDDFADSAIPALDPVELLVAAPSA